LVNTGWDEGPTRPRGARGGSNWQLPAAGHRRLALAGASTSAQRDFLVLSLELTIDGTPWLGAAPAIVGGEL
jgi:hypothetical protein